MRPRGHEYGRYADVQAAARLHQLAAKYYPTGELIEQEMSAGAKAALVWKITIEHLTGKEICER